MKYTFAGGPRTSRSVKTMASNVLENIQSRAGDRDLVYRFGKHS